MDEIVLKRCSKCEIKKPLAEFSRDSSRKDKLQPYCKQCQAIYRMAHKQDAQVYRESRKEEFRIYRQVNADRRRSYGAFYRATHKEQLKLKEQEYRKTHRDYINQKSRKWAKKNPIKRIVIQNRRKARQRNAEGSHTAQELADLWIEQDGKCVYCGCDLTETKKHLDHVVPLKRGGSNWITNLAWACAFCNLSKGDKLLSEWIK